MYYYKYDYYDIDYIVVDYLLLKENIFRLYLMMTILVILLCSLVN